MKKRIVSTIVILSLMILSSCNSSINNSNPSSSIDSVFSPVSSDNISSSEENSSNQSSTEDSSNFDFTSDSSLENSSESTPSVHVHSYGDWVVDKENNEFERGQRHKICGECGDIVTEITPYTIEYPRVYINYQEYYPTAPDATDYNGFANWTWEYLTVPIKFEGFNQGGVENIESVAQMRIQGATSKDPKYLKKNYTIKLYSDRNCTTKNDVTVVPTWGSQNKYVLKANWIDYTSARNLVAADLWSDVVESRSTSQVVSSRDYTEKMIHNGAVDGFPIMLYFNDEYYGLYTFNIPKDNWLFGMKKSNTEALLFADGTMKKEDGSLYQSTAFKELIQWDNNTLSGSGWELEYANDETNTQWIADSMNNVINLVMNTYLKLDNNMSLTEKITLRDTFKNEAPKYLDVDGCIDYMIFLHAIQGFPDNSTKNVIWSTYDGKIWTPNAYDLDTIWGMAWNGEMYVFEGKEINETTGGFWTLNNSWYRANLRGNALFEAILLFYADEAQQRYNELREEGAPLSYTNISEKMISFVNLIPEVIYQREATDYSSRPSEQINPITGEKNTTNLNQLLSYSEKILNFMDQEYNGDKMEINKNYFN